MKDIQVQLLFAILDKNTDQINAIFVQLKQADALGTESEEKGVSSFSLPDLQAEFTHQQLFNCLESHKPKTAELKDGGSEPLDRALSKKEIELLNKLFHKNVPAEKRRFSVASEPIIKRPRSAQSIQSVQSVQSSQSESEIDTTRHCNLLMIAWMTGQVKVVECLENNGLSLSPEQLSFVAKRFPVGGEINEYYQNKVMLMKGSFSLDNVPEDKAAHLLQCFGEHAKEVPLEVITEQKDVDGNDLTLHEKSSDILDKAKAWILDKLGISHNEVMLEPEKEDTDVEKSLSTKRLTLQVDFFTREHIKKILGQRHVSSLDPKLLVKVDKVILASLLNFYAYAGTDLNPFANALNDAELYQDVLNTSGYDGTMPTITIAKLSVKVQINKHEVKQDIPKPTLGKNSVLSDAAASSDASAILPHLKLPPIIEALTARKSPVEKTERKQDQLSEKPPTEPVSFPRFDKSNPTKRPKMESYQKQDPSERMARINGRRLYWRTPSAFAPIPKIHPDEKEKSSSELSKTVENIIRATYHDACRLYGKGKSDRSKRPSDFHKVKRHQNRRTRPMTSKSEGNKSHPSSDKNTGFIVGLPRLAT